MEKHAIDANTVAVVNQVSKDAETYYLGDAAAPVRILVAGNSITRHGPKADIGWNGDWGMAASCAQNDYVHRLAAMLCEAGVQFYMCVHQASRWEHALNKGERLLDFADCRNFGADVVVYRLAENIANTVSAEEYAAALDEFIGHINPKGGKVLYTTSFWKKPSDAVTKAAAAAAGMPCVFLGDLGDDSAMKAEGLFEHGGVAAHPGDAGMEAIARRVFAQLLPLVRSKE